MAALLRADGHGIQAIDTDAIASACSKALIFLRESLDDYGRGRGRKGLFQEHVEGAGEGDETEAIQELAAVAILGEIVSRMPHSGCDFSKHCSNCSIEWIYGI